MKGKYLIWKKHNIFYFSISLYHSLSLPFSPSLFLFLFLSFSFILSLSLALFHSLSHFSPSFLSPSLPVSLSLCPTVSFSHSLPFSLSLSIFLYLSIYLSFSLYLSIFLSLSQASLCYPFSPLNSFARVRCNLDLNLVVGQCSIHILPGNGETGMKCHGVKGVKG
jgi:hypothetical protein